MGTFFHNHKILRVLSVIMGVIIIILLAIIIFLKTWTVFGGSASKADMEDYAKRAINYNNGKFSNEEPFQVMTTNPGIDDNIISDKGTEPKDEIPTGTPDFVNINSDQVHVTWFGHSSLLLQINGMNILIDPMFSERSSPVSFAGSKRFSRPSIKPEDLPEIDVVILSHDHYDHMDYNTLKQIDGKVKNYVVPLGVENHLERWNIDSGKIQDMAWWEETKIGGLTIGCTPALHYSGRSIDDQNSTLWASWVFKTDSMKIFESGDTGYGEHFKQINDKYGDFDFALLDCAQYDVRWASVHMFPEEAIQAALSLGAKKVMPIHWGAFQLAEHPWDDPAERFTKAGEENGMMVVTPLICETMKLENATEYQQRWWKAID